MSDIHFLDGGGPGPVVLCLHGFGDHGAMYAPLLDTALGKQVRLIAPDLPGCGASPPDLDVGSIDAQARCLAQFILALAPSGPIVLVGHSIASPVAVSMQIYLEKRCAGVFSIEGNLTARDAYFSGQANKWDDPDAFLAHLVKGTRNMANFKPELTRYGDALERADAQTLWNVGKDAYNLSRDDQFGMHYRSLSVPSLYYWSSATTPASTQAYLTEHAIPAARFESGGHWPTIAEPVQTAQAISDFVATVI